MKLSETMECVSGYNTSYWMMLCLAVLALVALISSLFLCYYMFIATTDASTTATRDSRMKIWIVVSALVGLFAMIFSIYGFVKINGLGRCVTVV